jgi:pSer/pThr/pTyr-binding forkhead associated (FHA) protein
MALTVVVRSGDSQSPPSITFDAPRIVIGRGEGCEVRLPDPSVSHRHASLRQRDAEYVVIDEGSTNGTFVGQVRLSPHSPRAVKSGDLIRVGRVWLELLIEHVVPTQQQQVATAEIALGLVASALAAEGQASAPVVRIEEGPDQGAQVELSEFDRPYVVGRSPKAGLSVKDSDASRRHVELIRHGARVFVRDLNSKNGTRLGDQIIEPNVEVTWPAERELWVGQNRLGYEDPVNEALAELERVADERMRKNESVEPPNVADGDTGSESKAGETGARSDSSRPAPIAALPKRTATHRPAKTGWNLTDVLVALLALVVMGLSLAGLLWLFGSI